jgi:Protein of unknown function (DUF3551)
MKALMLGLAIAAVVVTGREAAAQGAWCADDAGPRTRTCNFYTFEQCLAFIRGLGGSCSPNPYLARPLGQPDKRIKRPPQY